MGKVVEFTRAIGPRASKPLWRHVLGEVLRGERLDQERILTEVAATAGVSPQYLSEIERGRKEPSSEILGSVADALGLELLDVVRRVGERLGARLDEERRQADRRERLVVEASFAFRADALPGHPLDLSGTDAAGTVVVTGAEVPAPSDVFLLAA
ncbi:helix-turn-helix domain-containing protein [Agromyces sp. Soil535]|uniref:helix-turn-helix domain-containing protein n=1 Tax=Agromyces sp. Soil535 TaxID=1736390 RepID=UPI0009E82C7D|nr:helix-turn-helix transcriptional regulator [Agromyces sp. Soil535]